MGKITEVLEQELNPEQCAAAKFVEGSSLILAGAGSGKTRTLTYKIAFLLWELGLTPQDILAVTFTNKAAREMRERLNELAEKFGQPKFPARGEGALQRVGTFHSIFLKILQQDIEALGLGYTRQFSILDAGESKALFKEIVKKKWLDGLKAENERRGKISKLKNAGIGAEQFAGMANSNRENQVAELYAAYQKDLLRSNVLDFDDLLFLSWKLLDGHPEVAEKWQENFPFILVDEAQDTNEIQFSLLRILSKKFQNVTLIGDDFQSIYGRRGAAMDQFLRVKEIRPNLEMFILSKNYRSKEHIVKASSALIAKNQKQYEKTLESVQPCDDKITILGHPNDVGEVQHTVEFLKKMQGKIFQNWSDVAILYRTNAQSSLFEQLFLQEQIPYVIRGGYKFFDRKEVKDVMSYLKILHNSSDSMALKRIINIPTRKIGKTTVEKLEDFAVRNEFGLWNSLEMVEQVEGVNTGAKASIKSFVEKIGKIRAAMEVKTPAEIIDFLLKEIGYKKWLLDEEKNESMVEERMENIGQLINIAEKFPDVGAESFRIFLEEVSLLADVMEEDKESSDAVKLMTIHSSKGLEFPVVFVVGLEEGLFPLFRDQKGQDELEEERRLLYVAMTRAKHHLFLSYAHSRMKWGRTATASPSAFLDEIPLEFCRNLDFAGMERAGPAKKFDEGDRVRHKLFGPGEIVEVWNDEAVVQFVNPRFGLRKVPTRFLE